MPSHIICWTVTWEDGNKMGEACGLKWPKSAKNAIFGTFFSKSPKIFAFWQNAEVGGGGVNKEELGNFLRKIV